MRTSVALQLGGVFLVAWLVVVVLTHTAALPGLSSTRARHSDLALFRRTVENASPREVERMRSIIVAEMAHRRKAGDTDTDTEASTDPQEQHLALQRQGHADDAEEEGSSSGDGGSTPSPRHRHRQHSKGRSRHGADADADTGGTEGAGSFLVTGHASHKRAAGRHGRRNARRHDDDDEISDSDSESAADADTDADPTPRPHPRRHASRGDDSNADSSAGARGTRGHHAAKKHRHRGHDAATGIEGGGDGIRNVGDNEVRAHPGGTEREALAERRRLSEKNWPIRRHSDAVWRDPPAGAAGGDGEAEEEEGAGAKKMPPPHSITQLQRRDNRMLAELYTAAKGRCKAPSPEAAGESDDGSEEGGESSKSHALIKVGCFQKQYYTLFQKHSKKVGGGDDAGGGESRAECEEIYSYPSIVKFQQSKLGICVGPDSDSEESREDDGEGASRVIHSSGMTCHTRRIRGHTSDTAVCEATDVVLNFDKMPHARDYPWLDFQRGALKGRCDIPHEARGRFKQMFMQCIADWFVKGLDTFTEGSAASEGKCDVYVDTPTYFVTRAGDYSPFHIAHDFTNAFISAAVLGFDFHETQIVIHDRMTKGFYLPLWQWVYTPFHKLLWYPDLKEKYGGKNVCFRRAMFNVPARLSLLYNNHESCIHTPSTTLRAWSDFVLGAFGLVGFSSKKDTLSISLIVRRNYKTGHAIGRRFGNEDEVIRALEGLEVEGRRVVVHPIDYAIYDFDTQMQISRTTDVLVAMHGAGLIQMSFLPQWGGVFEFFCPEKPSSNFRYKHLAGYFGLSYSSFTIADAQNTVPIPEATKRLHNTLLTVSRRKDLFHQE